MRLIGADVVGMSTVPEVLAAVHSGMQVLGLSIVTDLCLPDALRPANIADILATAAAAEPKLRKIVLGILAHKAGEKRDDSESPLFRKRDKGRPNTPSPFWERGGGEGTLRQ